jgi:hypothetical protein
MIQSIDTILAIRIKKSYTSFEWFSIIYQSLIKVECVSIASCS